MMGDKRIRKLVADSKLSDFDPEKSAREKRKISRRSYAESNVIPKSVTQFDERGYYRATNENLCDCLDNSCTGCHFPCPNCKSPKCGPSCRVNRKWAYESIEHDGKDQVIRNSNLDK